MNNNTNTRLTAEAWANIVIKIWEEYAKNLNIKSTGDLVESFYCFVHTEAEGNPDRIDFFFKYYGKFVDQGVGKGTSLLDLEINPYDHKRQKKPWFTDTFFYQVNRLREIMAEKYADKAAISIVNTLNIDNK